MGVLITLITLRLIALYSTVALRLELSQVFADEPVRPVVSDRIFRLRNRAIEKSMKSCISFLITLCLLPACAQTNRAPIESTTAVSRPLPFSLGPSCFAGIRNNYDDWANSVVGQNPDRSLELFETRFPRNDYEKYKRDLDCNYISYPVGDLVIRGIYARPKQVAAEKLPVVIINRGGNGSFGAWNTNRLFHSALPLASEGFVVIGSQYRGSQKGVRRTNDANDEFGGSDVDDVLALFDVVDNTPGIDPNRIGMSGWSRGGMMTFIVATKTDRLRAIAVGGTPTDLAAELLHRPEMERVFRARIPNYDANKEAALADRSALKWPDEIDPDLPILILHGEADESVTVASAEKMAKALQALGRPVKLVVYEGGTHGLMEYKQEFNRELATWFKEHLANSL